MKKKIPKDSVKPITAMDVLLQKTGQPQSRSASLLEQYPSVMSLARADVGQLMKSNPGLHITQARKLHEQATAMSVVIARQFREQRLTASVRQANRPPTGIKGLVDGPTYTDMFNPDWANHCPPDAIEATTSPVAYLADLYRYAKELEATGKPAEVITLDARRPDLKDLVLDHTALNRIEPTIVLVNEILEKSIRSHLDGISLTDTSVDDALLEARYPNALPFERYTSQINYVLGRKGYSLGDVIRAADPAYPYFKEPGVHSLLSDTALIQDTGFGPVQQALLLEAPYFPDAEKQTRSLIADKWRIDPRTRLLVDAGEGDVQATKFFQDNFGVGGFSDLEDTQTFCLRTGLKTEELEALLSVGAFAPSPSPNVTAIAAGEVDGSVSGSVYINAGQAPAMAIETLPGEMADGVLIQGPRHRITHASPDRFDRMNRMIRLARWLGLPFDEVDQIIVACMRAENQKDFPVITTDTLRAIGLFQTLRGKYKMASEDFAALIQGIGVYGRGKESSHFDRVFNSQALFSIPLKLDDTPMVLAPTVDAERQKIDHLCASLGMTYETFRYVARVIVQARGDQPLLWSIDVVSTCYRLTKLPKYLGKSVIEALALIEVIDNGATQLMSKIAGVAQVKMHSSTPDSDTLSVIHAWVDCVAWMQGASWQVEQLYSFLGARFTEIVATDAEHNLLEQINQRLQSALITESSFAEIGAPNSQTVWTRDAQGQDGPAMQSIDWFEELQAFIDTGGETDGLTKGLIKHLGDAYEPNFEHRLIENVKKVLADLNLVDEALGVKISNRVMRARGEQGALLMEGLSGYLSVSSDHADALLTWAQGNSYLLLREVRRVTGGDNTIQVPIGDDVLELFMELSKRAAVTRHLQLGPALIRQFLSQPDWFGLPHTGLSFPAIYILTQYASVVRRSDQSEDTLLDYLRLVNTYKGTTEGDKIVIRESAAQRLSAYLRWGVRDVLAVALYLDSENGVTRTLQSIDVAGRLSLLGHQASLDAKALLALNALAPTSQTSEYRAAAEQALSNINSFTSESRESEVGQSRAHTITASTDYLVAKKQDEQAVFTINLRHLTDEPVADVPVRWTTSLGQLSDETVSTNAQGMASVTLGTSSEMGVAIVQAHFGLGETQTAPTVTIGYDRATLAIIDGERDPSSALANRLESVSFTAVLEDMYGNAGIDHPVTWETTLGEFQRHITQGDSNGVARAELKSLTHGSALVVARCENGDDFVFSPVEFISIPYFQYVHFANAISVGYEVRVECRVVEIDGSPAPAETAVKWTTDNGEFNVTSSTTNADGLASALLIPESAGSVIVTVESDYGPISKSSGSALVHPVTTLELTVSSDKYMIGAEPLVFSSGLKIGDAPAVGRRVDWYVDNIQRHSSDSNGEGVAVFLSRFALGPHGVKAVITGTDVGKSVNVQALDYKYECSLSGFLLSQAPGLLSRYETYTLTVNVFSGAEAVAGVPFMVKAKGAEELAITVVGLGTPQESSADGLTFSITFSAVALTGPFTLQIESGGTVKWSGDYKVGYYYRLDMVRFHSLRSYATLAPYSDISDINSIGGVLEGKTIYSEISIASENWSGSPTFRNPFGEPANVTADFGGGVKPSRGAIAVIQAKSALDGCFYLVESQKEVDVS
ncbi:MAG TPA: Tc toxin subunit A [Pseudomonas sp.]|uniref:Tc toxin subunit A n=1 Tax=Pseudomonas sp. TaxID=306 RepID=UPI002EDB9968